MDKLSLCEKYDIFHFGKIGNTTLPAQISENHSISVKLVKELSDHFITCSERNTSRSHSYYREARGDIFFAGESHAYA